MGVKPTINTLHLFHQGCQTSRSLARGVMELVLSYH
ncbi:hypothetical protein MXB_5681 [Myxobolus squamalis]|nr:hypothetical protein MXB_5681 [Myxobolus squamalis]